MSNGFFTNDFLGIWKGALVQNRGDMVVCRTSGNESLLRCLRRTGYVTSYVLTPNRKFFCVQLGAKGIFQLRHLRTVSNSSRKVFKTFRQLSCIYSPNDFFLVSTGRGVMTSQEIFFYGEGGLVLMDAFGT